MGEVANRGRRVAEVVHRYVGLFIAVFLVVAGFTGSLLVFHEELDAAINPRLHRPLQYAANAQLLDSLLLRERLLRALPEGSRIDSVPLRVTADRAVRFHVEHSDDEAPHDDEFFVDPYSGKVLGSRRYGDIRQGTKNLVPFLFRLHYSLALDAVGTTLFGVVALLWTFDCFVGAYLTLPPPARGAAVARAGAWLRRWRRAWLIRTQTFLALLFTWHRASGLWAWAMLLVFAWSAVALNLDGFYSPVMHAVLGPSEVSDKLPTFSPARPYPSLSWEDARARGRFLMARESQAQSIVVLEERRLRYFPQHGAFQYQARTSADVSTRYARTAVWIDGGTGRSLGFESATGQNARTTADSWLFALHFADVAAAGVSYRVFVLALGLVVVLLSVSGVLIWLRKRRGRFP